jgi:hypothetical protein
MSHAILLTCEGEFGRIAANYLAPRFPGLVTVIDAPLSRLSLLRGRARRKGATVAAGQAAFMAFQRLQRLYSGARIEAIKRASGLDSGVIATKVVRLGDVNGEASAPFLWSGGVQSSW